MAMIRRPGRGAILGLLLGTVLLFSAQRDVSAGGQANRFAGGGEYASVSWFDFDSLSSGFIVVSRSGSADNPQTWLNYHISQNDSLVAFGFGTVSNQDLQGSTASHLRLHTDVSQEGNPGFTRIEGAGGMVSIDWERTQYLSIESNGITRIRMGDGLTILRSNTSTSSAAVRGAVADAAIPSAANGEIGKSQSMVIDVQRGP